MKIIKRITTLLAPELPFFVSLPAIVWQLLLLCIPILFMGYLSISSADGFSLHQYAPLFSMPYMRIIARSCLLAASTAFFCLLLAYPVAYFVALRAQKFKWVLLFLLSLPLWTNFLVQVYAWFFLLEHNGLINKLLLSIGILDEPWYMANTIGAVLVVMVYCYLPFMIMPLYSVLEKLDVRLLDASSDLGATWQQTCMRVVIPLSTPGMVTGFLLVFVPAFGEFAIPALIGGSKYLLVGSLITHSFLVARDPAAGAAFTYLSGALLAVIVLLVYWFFGVSYRQVDKIVEYEDE